MKLAKTGFLWRAWLVVADAFGHFNADDGWAMASHVALTALMALFPFLIFVAQLAGFIGQAPLASQVADFLFATWPEQVAGPIAAEVSRVLTSAHSSLLTVSALVALYLASNGVEAVRTALNRAYRVVDRRSIFFRRGQSVLFVLIGATAFLIAAVIVVAVASLPALGWLQQIIAYAGLALTTLLVIAALIIAHVFLPAGRPPWRALWPGIVATLVAWVVAGWVFAFYLREFANYTATYAGLAGVVIAIFFLYVVAMLMLFGAEFNAALQRLRDDRIG